MSNFLTHLILTSRGELSTVRPRQQARFEPPRPTQTGLTAAEAVIAPTALDHDPSLAAMDRPTDDFSTLAPTQPKQARRDTPTSSRHPQDPAATQQVPSLSSELTLAVGGIEVTSLPMTISSSMAVKQIDAPSVGDTLTAPQPTPLTEDAPQIRASTLMPKPLVGASPIEKTPATQPADHRLGDGEQTAWFIPQRQAKESRHGAAPETGTDQMAATTVAPPTPAVAPLFTSVVSPAARHEVSKPSNLMPMATPFFNTGQPSMVAAQPQAVLSADQVTPTASSTAMASQPTQPRRLTQPGEELTLPQVVPATQPINGVATAREETVTNQALARREAASPTQPEARRAPLFAPAAPATEPAPVIRVTIGRIEVRALQPTPAPAPQPAARQPDNRLSLEAYLKQSRRTP